MTPLPQSIKSFGTEDRAQIHIMTIDFGRELAGVSVNHTCRPDNIWVISVEFLCCCAVVHEDGGLTGRTRIISRAAGAVTVEE